ncbi:nitrilase-related carbon-nitrogen hydrolase [Puia sp. P3]|uniref:nitrilase-related carbon-nitrogen hydrolase n=1 Tax=Puia sp. P3 TaxID=3423952 RepID=UPI003D6751D0
MAWKTLLRARAIENQSYVIGVNRVGDDGNNIHHSGDSMIIDPLGEILYESSETQDVHTITLQKTTLQRSAVVSHSGATPTIFPFNHKAPMATAFIAREIFTGTEIHTGSAVLVREGTVTGIVPISDIPAGYRQRELSGYLLAPAFLDLQIYGGNGKLFSAEMTTEALEATYEYCLQGGCTQFQITLATNSIEKFLRGLEVAKQYRNQGGKGLLGVHLEGPYINPVKKGAHIEKFIKKPTEEELASCCMREKRSSP